MPILKTVPEFVVNSTLSFNQVRSSTTALAGNRFAVAYTDSDGNGLGVRMRQFNADGTQYAAEFLANGTISNDQSESSLATLSNGTVILTYTDASTQNTDNSVQSVRFRLITTPMSSLVADANVNTTVLNNQFASSVTTLTGGGFVVTFTDESATGDDSSSFAVRARIFDNAGVAASNDFVVNTGTLFQQSESSVTALSDGRFVVTFKDNGTGDGDSSGTAIRARIFNANGTESVPQFRVNTTVGNNQLDAHVAALANGKFVVSYTDNSQSPGDLTGSAVRARIFNANGTEAAPEFVVNSTTFGNQSASAVATLADGRFVITYTDSSALVGDTTGNAIRARIFNPDGTQAVAEFLVNTATVGSQEDSTVTALADGRFVVTFTDFSMGPGDTSGAAIRAQIFDPTIFDGTAAGEEATGGSLNDRYSGYGGSDTLKGSAGDDTLDGGAASDTLTGGSGADRFVFVRSELIAGANDTITDYNPGEGDVLVVKGGTLSEIALTGAGLARSFNISAATNALTMTQAGNVTVHWYATEGATTLANGAVRNYDAAGFGEWAEYTQFRDSQNRFDYESGVYDGGWRAGGSWTTDVDQAGNQYFVSYRNEYNGAGQVYQQFGLTDDGRSWEFVIAANGVTTTQAWGDQNGTREWSGYIDFYDTFGRFDYEIGTYDAGWRAGGTWSYDQDQNNDSSFVDWYRNEYNAVGQLYQQFGYTDDGRAWELWYDNANVNTFQRWNDVANNYSFSYYTDTRGDYGNGLIWHRVGLNDNGSVIDLYY